MINFNQTFIELLPGNVYIKDCSGVYLACSNEFASILQLGTAQDIVGKTDYDLLPMKQARKIIENDKIVINEKKIIAIEEVGINRSGIKATYITRKTPLFGNDGQVLGLVGISIDISHQKNLEEELRLAKEHTENYLQNAVEQIPGLITWKNQQGCYLGCNKLAAKTFGLNNPQEIVGKNDYDLFNKEIADEIVKDDFEVLAAGKESEKEESKIFPDGKRCIYITRRLPLYNKALYIIGVISTAFDITERKEAEQKRLDTMKALGVIVAHEMRTPLAAIGVGATGVLKYYPDLINTYSIAKEAHLDIPIIPSQAFNKITTILQNIQHEVKSANMFIDLIVTNMAFTGHSNAALERCSAAQCVNHAFERYPFTAAERQKIHWENNSDNDFIFLGQETLVTHILFNLMKNALYFIQDASLRPTSSATW